MEKNQRRTDEVSKRFFGIDHMSLTGKKIIFGSCSPLFNVQKIRELEVYAGPTEPSLMEQAGAVAAQRICHMFGPREFMLVLAGPGNNGGDAFVCARHLKARGYSIQVLFLGEVTRLPKDAAMAYALWCLAGGEVQQIWPEEDPAVIIDGLLGIGLSRPLKGIMADYIERINHSGAKVVSLDIPSGLDADFGTVANVAIRADATVTFIGLKPGFYTAQGVEHVGKVFLEKLQIPSFSIAPSAWLLNENCLKWPEPRKANSHKGLFGEVRILGGPMRGASLLAALAALRSGVGRVVIAWLDDAGPDLDPVHPELIFTKCKDLLLGLRGILLIGPGYGQTDAAIHLLEQILKSDAMLLLDADALNLVASRKCLKDALRHRKASAILTPHPLEAARLLGCTVETIQSDRLGNAKMLSKEFGQPVVIKGAGSVIAAPEGEVWVSPWAIPLLAIPGSGDVLAGLVASLAAQGLSDSDALRLGVWLHGHAGAVYQQEMGGPIGAMATELTLIIRRLLNAKF
ncbi:MAG: NAD(P)H-hydrate dehydratase [Pseudomonadota bacterium]|nr:NAD(P)H-hydrate dehydratase [Pseudomonadota bacterium]